MEQSNISRAVERKQTKGRLVPAHELSRLLAGQFAGNQCRRAPGATQANDAEQDENGRGSQGYSVEEFEKQVGPIHSWIMRVKVGTGDITKGQQGHYHGASA